MGNQKEARHMDHTKIGGLIRRLRQERGMTQRQLAERMGISDKTVSKWERGMGCPDLSLLPDLSDIFHVGLDQLLTGELDAREALGGNMKRTAFYICPDCGNVVAAMADAAVSCCGKRLEASQPQKAEGEDCLTVETVENDLFITSDHPMSKDHYITFAALLTGDSLILRKQYPEWGLQVRLPAVGHGRLLWYCSRHGLFCQPV